MQKMTKSSNKKTHIKNDEEYLISMLDITLIIARQIKIILITPSIFCTLSIFYALFIATPVYLSTSKIMSSSGGNSNISQAVGIAAQFGINLPNNSSETKWVYPEIIKSRTLAKSILKRRFDSNIFGEGKTLFEILSTVDEASEFDINALELKAVETFLDMISVSEDLKTNIISINVSSIDPKLSAEINNALIDELDSYQQKYNKERTSETRQFIEERIIDTEKELIKAEEKLKIFMGRNRRMENSPALLLEQQRLTREVTVLTGVFTTLKQQLETVKIEEVKKSNYVMIIEPAEVPFMRSEPKRKRMVVIAGILGIAFGLMIGFIREYFNTYNDDEMKKWKEVKFQITNNLKSLNPLK